MKMKLGRLPRKFNPAVKHLKALAPHGVLPLAPSTCDWTRGYKSFGMMLNDQLGDCTCAAVYHARQIWTANTSNMNTQPDAEVLKLYEKACGYVPSDPNTDQGGSEQDVLTYLMNKGAPLSDGTTDKILGFVEVDQTKLNEVKLSISEFGVAYIGIEVPDSIYDASNNVNPVWDYVVGSPIEGGHAIVLVGYDNIGFNFISWGSIYKMTWSFFSRYCDEIYAIVNKNWITSSGKTPLGIALSDLETLMTELRE